MSIESRGHYFSGLLYIILFRCTHLSKSTVMVTRIRDAPCVSVYMCASSIPRTLMYDLIQDQVGFSLGLVLHWLGSFIYQPTHQNALT